jgi:hypothetical protein
MIVKATLARRDLNGLELVKPEVPLGKEYLVDMDTLGPNLLYNIKSNSIVPVQTVEVNQENDTKWSLYVFELLKLEDS